MVGVGFRYVMLVELQHQITNRTRSKRSCRLFSGEKQIKLIKIIKFLSNESQAWLVASYGIINGSIVIGVTYPKTNVDDIILGYKNYMDDVFYYVMLGFLIYATS